MFIPLPTELFVLPPDPPSDGSPAYVLCLEGYEDVAFDDIIDALAALRGFGRHHNVMGSVVRAVDGKVLSFTMPSLISMEQGRSKSQAHIEGRSTEILLPIDPEMLKRYVPRNPFEMG